VAQVQIDDLHSVRKILGKSQREMAELLGISIRAVQSYEQGWRSMTPATQRLALLFLFLRWRQTQKKVKPCWKIRGCAPKDRAQCPVYVNRGGEFCWLISGNRYDHEILGSWKAKLAACQACPVMQRWIPTETEALGALAAAGA